MKRNFLFRYLGAVPEVEDDNLPPRPVPALPAYSCPRADNAPCRNFPEAERCADCRLRQ